MSDKTRELSELVGIWVAVKNNASGEVWNTQIKDYVDDRIVELLSVTQTPVTTPLPLQEMRSLKYLSGKDNSEYLSVSKISQTLIDFMKENKNKFVDQNYEYLLTDKWFSRRKKA